MMNTGFERFWQNHQLRKVIGDDVDKNVIDHTEYRLYNYCVFMEITYGLKTVRNYKTYRDILLFILDRLFTTTRWEFCPVAIICF